MEMPKHIVVTFVIIAVAAWIVIASRTSLVEGFASAAVSCAKNDWFASLSKNVGGPIPLPEGQLDIFSENAISPDCCPAIYSSGPGCVCISEKQMKYLNERGGNRTLTSYY